MNLVETPIADLYVIEPRVFVDNRGDFHESYNKTAFAKAGLNYNFVQDNMSRSIRGTLRGLHFQTGEMAQAKFVYVPYGRVLDVAVDLRPLSRTFKKSYAVELSGENHRQFLIPRGFAHGFLCLSETAIFGYKCDNFYSKEHDGGIRFDDPDLAIDWPMEVESLVISDKDRALPYFRDIEGRL